MGQGEEVSTSNPSFKKNNMNFMPYSPATMQSAFNADESRITLHRHMITVADAQETEYGVTKEAEEYEKHKEMFETMHQGDNMSFSA